MGEWAIDAQLCWAFRLCSRVGAHVWRQICLLQQRRVWFLVLDCIDMWCSTVRVWDVAGQSLQEFYGHTSFVYAIAVSPNGQEIASVGEDRSLRIWDTSMCYSWPIISVGDGECTQVVTHPCVSVWTAA